MRIILLLFTIIISIQLTSCGTTEPPPPKKEKPPGYQEDIPWPSLADSPWPMYHGDPQSTGRSKYCNALTGNINWKYSANSKLVYGAPIISRDSITFVPYTRDGLVAINTEGKLAWNFVNFEPSVSSPILAAKDIIYFWGFDGVRAIDLNGEQIWHFKETSYSNLGTNIGIDGTIYFMTEDLNLFALNSDGTLKWKVYNKEFLHSGLLSFSPDGNTLYIPGNGTTLIAFSVESESILWKFGGKNIYCDWSLVDSEGNIYVSSSIKEDSEDLYFISLKPDGSIRWTYPHNSYYKEGNKIYNELAQPTIDKNGNLYFVSDTLYSLNYDGKLRWKYPLNGFVSTPLVCDAENNIYVEIFNGSGNFDLACFNDSGNILFYLSNLEGDWGYSPAVGYDNLIVPTDGSSQIYSIK